MIDEAESFVNAAKLLKDRGAYKILVMVTHGLLSADAPELIEESAIDEVKHSFCSLRDVNRSFTSKLVRCKCLVRHIDVPVLKHCLFRRF